MVSLISMNPVDVMASGIAAPSSEYTFLVLFGRPASPRTRAFDARSRDAFSRSLRLLSAFAAFCASSNLFAFTAARAARTPVATAWPTTVALRTDSPPASAQSPGLQPLN